MIGRSWGTRIRLTLSAALATGALALAAQPASAVVSGSAVVSPELSYTVGIPKHASFTLTNTSNQLTPGVAVQAIDLFPGCLSGFPECGAGLDPGAFSISVTATGTEVGSIGTGNHFNCAGTWSANQTAGEPGRFRFTAPGTGLELPGNNAGCRIDLTATALRLPSFDINPDASGEQSNFNVAATFYFVANSTQSRVGTSDETSVLPGAGPGGGAPGPAPSVTGPTGQRAAALAKCKKKHTKKARKKCKRKARRLPQ
jgi:hypothetical protein